MFCRSVAGATLCAGSIADAGVGATGTGVATGAGFQSVRSLAAPRRLPLREGSNWATARSVGASTTGAGGAGVIASTATGPVAGTMTSARSSDIAASSPRIALNKSSRLVVADRDPSCVWSACAVDSALVSCGETGSASGVRRLSGLDTALLPFGTGFNCLRLTRLRGRPADLHDADKKTSTYEVTSRSLVLLSASISSGRLHTDQ